MRRYCPLQIPIFAPRMEARSNIQIRLTGQRHGEPLQPANVELDYLIKALELTRRLLSEAVPDVGGVNVLVEQGSLQLRSSVVEDPAATFSTTLAKFGGDLRINDLNESQAKAIRGLRELAATWGDHVAIMNGGMTLLEFGPDTEFVEQDPQWTEAELYVRGLVTNVGGKSSPNIHIDIDDDRFGKLIVAATKEQITADDKNRLYKFVTLRIAIQQDAITSHYDTSSATLLDYIQTDKADDDVSAYLDRLIDQAAENWKKIKDKDSWLSDIRGYAG